MSLFNGIKWPYATMQQLNLDWILTEIKRVMGFFPEDGNAGEVLMKTEEGTAWEPLEAVDLNINALPEDTELTDTDKLVFYDLSASANRKITAPNLLNSMMSNGSPLMDGTGSAGTSKKPARADHRHPTDTSRAPASYFQNQALKIANGGTGATNAADARSALGVPGIGELTAQQTITIDGISFIFRKYGRIVVCSTYGAASAAIPTGAYYGETGQLDAALRPLSADIRYVTVLADATMMFSVGADGVFRIGYPSREIAAGVTLRGEDVYISAN